MTLPRFTWPTKGLPLHSKISFNGPGLSELNAVGEELLSDICDEVRKIFIDKHSVAFPVAFNLKKASIITTFDDGIAESGEFHWSVSLQMRGAQFTKDAYITIPFDSKNIYIPHIFSDNLGRVYSIAPKAIAGFMLAGADLSQHQIPIRPIR